MTAFKIHHAAIAAVIGATVGLSGCTVSEVKMSPDFGQAVRQDLVAQIADPDAHYLGTPAPGSNGARVGLAQKRYEKGQVIQPSSTTASSASSMGNVDNGTAPTMDSAGVSK